MTEEGFVVDDKLQQIAEAYALDAVDFARDAFALHLDWSDGSVQHIETILTRMHDEMASARPTQDQVLQFAKMFGSCVGEVFRRNHGGQWGMVTLGADTFPGMEANKGGGRFWPWGKVQKRLLNGAEDNVWHYYQHLAEQDGPGSPPPARPPQPRRSWWSRLWGA
jgi:hypothetical protein